MHTHTHINRNWYPHRDTDTHLRTETIIHSSMDKYKQNIYFLSHSSLKWRGRERDTNSWTCLSDATFHPFIHQWQKCQNFLPHHVSLFCLSRSPSLPIISVSYNLAQSHIYKYLVYKETDGHKCLKTGELVSKRVRLGEWGDTLDKKLYECGFRSLYISNYS